MSDKAGQALQRFYQVWPVNFASGYVDAVQEILDLLGVAVNADGKDFHILLQQNVGRSTSAINIDTRSAFGVLSAFGNGVDIPVAHLDQGIVDPLNHALSQDRVFIKIRSSKQAPKDATVRVFFRDHSGKGL